MHDDITNAIAAEAARWVVDTGLEYGAAKAKAAKALGRRGGSARHALPTDEQVEDEVRDLLALFSADSQPTELAALRSLALGWMDRLSAFRPHLAGAVWRGTATRHSAVHLDLYCDDSKSAEIALLDQGIRFEPSGATSGRGAAPDVLTVAVPCPALQDVVTLHLIIRDLDDLRGALKPDARGRSWRGDRAALQRLMQQDQAGETDAP
jgi:hypothetical protein